MLILHGNVMYPIVLRWSIIFMSAITPKSWSRKVYFRYLLLNGRHLHSNLFGSQQTWLLLIQQVSEARVYAGGGAGQRSEATNTNY